MMIGSDGLRTKIAAVDPMNCIGCDEMDGIMHPHVWIRAEYPTVPPRGAAASAEIDPRSPLVPDDARIIIEKGIKVTVEKSDARCILDSEFDAVGCELVAPGAWKEHAPANALIIGLRDVEPIPLASTKISGTHCFFAHAYKSQENWEKKLVRFLNGGGRLLDLEYLIDPNNNMRLASFGRVAGFIGMTAGIFQWCRQVLQAPRFGIQLPANLLSQLEGVAELSRDKKIEAMLNLAMTFSGRKPKILVIGAAGRCGQGAVCCAENLGFTINDSLFQWGRKDTKVSPIPELLGFDIVVNAIRLNDEISGPWLTGDLIRKEPRRLSVIVDISCDFENKFNPFPIYSRSTTFDDPALRILEQSDFGACLPLDVIAIPNLPSLLPLDSSVEFSKQLSSLIGAHAAVWKYSLDQFVLNTLSFDVSRLEKISKNVNEFISQIILFNHENARTFISKRFLIQDLQCDAICIPELQEWLIKQLSHSFDCDHSIICKQVTVSIDSDLSRKILLQVNFSNFSNSTVCTIIADSRLLDSRSCELLFIHIWHRIKDDTYRVNIDGASLSQILQYQSNVLETDSAYYTGIKRFWNQQREIASHLPPIQLPVDFSRTPKTEIQLLTIPRASCQFVIDGYLSQKVLEFTSDSNHFYAFFLSCLAILIRRYTNESEMIVKSSTSGRQRKSLMNSLASLSRPIFVLLDAKDSMTFEELYQNTLSRVSQIFEHQDFLEMDNSIHSTVEFHMHNSVGEIFHNKHYEDEVNDISSIVPENCNSELSFVVGVDSETSHLALSIGYRMDLFSKQSIEEMLRQFHSLIRETLNEPRAEILQYSLVTEYARSNNLIPDVNEILDSSWPGSIVEIFDKVALENSDAVAIEYRNQIITYGQLIDFVNQISSYIIECGLKKGDVIAIYGHRSPSIVATIMGILKSGAAYCMMDPKYPSSRIITCVEIAKCKGWIELETATDEVPLSADLDSFLTEQNYPLRISVEPIENLVSTDPLTKVKAMKFFSKMSSAFPNINPDDVAVVTFTSGSTGLPKGVQGRHVSLTHFYPWMSERFSISTQDRFSMCSGIAHDPLQRDIFTPLYFGSTIHIPTNEAIIEPGKLAKWMSKSKISITCLTPAMGQLLTTLDSEGNFETVKSLKLALFVGDSLIKRDVLRLKELAPNAKCINMYGSTETQRAVGYFEVPDNMTMLKEVIPVGKGMKDCQLVLLNKAGKLAGINEAAEIFVRSPHLAKGYLGLPEQTAKKFLPNPFSVGKDVNDRVYRTGDLGRYRAIDGAVECAGRADDQVKIRGFRIELGEINASLSRSPVVKENVTIVREDTPGDKRIVSYVVLNESSEGIAKQTLIETIRGHLKEHLPVYMVPSKVVILDFMPLTPNGKINRESLPVPELMEESVSDDFEKFSTAVHVLTDTERALTQIWSRLLNVRSIGLKDNFFDLGGHSLLATQLTIEISKFFQRSIPMNYLFSHPTIQEFAAAIDNLSTMKEFSREEKIDLFKECELPADLDELLSRYKDLDHAKSLQDSRKILLTGATGFLGVFLLRELLTESNAEIYCLVRAPDDSSALSRVRNAMKNHLIYDESYFKKRVFALASDLGKSRLGLSSEKFDWLCEEMDIVFHNAAQVHWLYPYEKLKRSNVESTIWLLRLAASFRAKSFHYISTTSVFNARFYQSSSKVMEDDSLDHIDGLSGGYPQSKWVSERILKACKKRGLLSCVYRPGYICGDSKSGVWNADDFLCRLIKGCIQLGASPFPTYPQPSNSSMNPPRVDMSPVDYVASVIVAAANSDQCFALSEFNVVNPNPIPFHTLFEQVGKFGFSVPSMPYPVWRDRLFQSIREGESENALFSIAAQFTEDWASNQQPPPCDRRNLDFVIQDREFPDLSMLMPVYLAYLVRCGFLDGRNLEHPLHDHLDWSLIGEKVQLLTRTNRS